MKIKLNQETFLNLIKLKKFSNKLYNFKKYNQKLLLLKKVTFIKILNMIVKKIDKLDKPSKI